MNKELISFVKAISDETRLAILNYLKKECCVGDIWKRLNLPQNLASHHLRILKEAGLVIAKRDGLKVVYKLDKKKLASDLKSLQIYLK